MSAAENKALVRRYWDEVVNPGNLDLIDELYAPDYVLHAPDGDVHGPEGVRRQLAAYRAAFPDLRAELVDEVAEGEKVVQRVVARGTHRGELFGVPPTGNPVTITGIVISRVAAGKIAEEWEVIDLLGVLQQLGAIPTRGRRATSTPAAHPVAGGRAAGGKGSAWPVLGGVSRRRRQERRPP